MKLTSLLLFTGLATFGVMLLASPQRQRRYRLADGHVDTAPSAADAWDQVDETSAESFPASDPPARY